MYLKRFIMQIDFYYLFNCPVLNGHFTIYWIFFWTQILFAVENIWGVHVGFSSVVNRLCMQRERTKAVNNISNPFANYIY